MRKTATVLNSSLVHFPASRQTSCKSLLVSLTWLSETHQGKTKFWNH